MSTTVNYKGDTIATLSNETKTLTTAGSWLEDDIEITDIPNGVVITDTTDSHGGTIRTITSQNTLKLQSSKTVTPGSSAQTITPDTGYDGFSSVIVEPAPVGSNAIIRTVIINNSVGDVDFPTVLSACEAMGYTLTHDDCMLRFRAKGINAHSNPPSNYSYNNHTILVKDGAVWNVNYNQCDYKSGILSPDTFNNADMIRLNNAIQNSGNIIDGNKKIVNTYASAFEGIGGSGTTVTLYEIPMNWSDFLTTV